jgi:hypothetical protein
MGRRLLYSPVLVKAVELEGIVVDIRVPARHHQLVITNQTITNVPLHREPEKNWNFSSCQLTSISTQEIEF